MDVIADVLDGFEQPVAGGNFDRQVTDIVRVRSFQPRVQNIAQPVAQHVHTQRQGQQGAGGEEQDPPFTREQEALPDADQRAQRWLVGGAPTPRKLSVASAMIASAREMVAITKTGDKMFGRICRSMMDEGLRPISRAADT